MIDVISTKTVCYLVFALLASWVIIIIALGSLFAAWKEIKEKKETNKHLQRQLDNYQWREQGGISATK